MFKLFRKLIVKATLKGAEYFTPEDLMCFVQEIADINKVPAITVSTEVVGFEDNKALFHNDISIG